MKEAKKLKKQLKKQQKLQRKLAKAKALMQATRLDTITNLEERAREESQKAENAHIDAQNVLFHICSARNDFMTAHPDVLSLPDALNEFLGGEPE